MRCQDSIWMGPPNWAPYSRTSQRNIRSTQLKPKTEVLVGGGSRQRCLKRGDGQRFSAMSTHREVWRLSNQSGNDRSYLRAVWWSRPGMGVASADAVPAVRRDSDHDRVRADCSLAGSAAAMIVWGVVPEPATAPRRGASGNRARGAAIASLSPALLATRHGRSEGGAP